MSQYTLPCVVYRGGTSRGIFFHEKDLPNDPEKQRQIFLQSIDAYNNLQVNGLGGGNSHTSKVVVISPSLKENIDVNYTFYQVGIGVEVVDDRGTCGNLMAAVGAFAVDEGLVEAEYDAEFIEVSVYNTNINKKLFLTVPLENGEAKVAGDYYIQGLSKPGARFRLDIFNPGGGKTGKTQPLGAVQTVKTKNGTYAVSFVDVVNPCVYVASEALGINGTELNSELSTRDDLLEELEEIRCDISVQTGIADSLEAARKAPSIPKIAIVAKAQGYKTSDGRVINGEEVDIVTKMLSMGNFHRTFAASCLHNVASAALLKETVPNLLSELTDCSEEQMIRIGHPEGIVEVRVRLTDNQDDVAFVGLDRTARKIMKGDLFIESIS
ncbi:PrpF domain-containing protein [Aquibacillus saliphilus]|uniref:PrpF domain-containing protein n=1 Tax=Aquibacillus saliphilus TaxID=1909422 RepID=UPI001CF0B5F7|nr:PrpF domain-containing protein [Aquibacillus saliphilus]